MLLYINLYICKYIYPGLPHPRNGDSQGQEFLAPSADKPAIMTQSAQTTIPPYQP